MVPSWSQHCCGWPPKSTSGRCGKNSRTEREGRSAVGKKSRKKKNREKEYIGPDGQPILCYLCRKRPATTDDHVPPECIFPSGASFRGFEIPSCRPCNNGFAKDDEYFRDVITMASTNADALKVLQEGTIRSMTRPWAQLQRVRKVDRIMANTFPVRNISPSGLILEPRLAF